MARSRRKKKTTAGEWGMLVLGGLFALSLLGAASSTLAKVFAALVAAAGVAGLALLLALIADTVNAVLDSLRGRPPRGLRLTQHVLHVVSYPVRPFLWLRGVFREPPIRVQTIGELLALTHSDFEEVIAQSFRDRGYRNVVRKGGPGDLGVDITCRDPNGATLAVQCKRYGPGNLVGSREIQLFIGMVTTEHRTDRGVFITTSDFTKPARTLAERHGIRLINGVELARMLGAEGPPLHAATATPYAPASGS